ncbi:MAG: DEAD/DEAH box helicase [Candidatus Latescibacterota bacterium]|jgi:superfamily II DNA/RNA helicase
MTTFSDLGLASALESALIQDHITEPTAIQEQAIPILLAGSDAYISSETGTGKTLAYLLPLFSKIDPTQRTLQSIIVVPTHELAMQIAQVGRDLAQHAGMEIRLQVLIGGASIKRQVEKLKSKPHIVIGTAGRINELIDAKKIKPHTVQQIIVDEVDRLLFGDSLESIQKIIKATLRERQLVFVSATKQDESSTEAKALAPALVPVYTGSDQVNAAIEHFYIECEERDKVETLRSALSALRPERAIVFVHRNANAEEITSKLVHHKIAAVDLYGTQDNMKRKRAIDDFRDATANVLLASDIAARGLDIQGVTHVFNFDIPTQSKDYLHRVGRTSRAGSEGCAISLMTEQELRLVKRYTSELNIEMRAAHLSRGTFNIDRRS